MEKENKCFSENKQSFLSSAITDISSNIQLVDTKTSILLAAVTAILAAVTSCYEPIAKKVFKICPCSWNGVVFAIFVLVCLMSIIVLFIFGIMTISAHTPTLKYKSKWFLNKSVKDYTFDEFYKDVELMQDNDIIENMAAELYKLNDINRKKLNSYKIALSAFSIALSSAAISSLILFIS